MTTTAGVHRKVAAILCADVEGYSRLIADDPEATIETLSRYRTVFAECSQCLDKNIAPPSETTQVNKAGFSRVRAK